MARLAVVYDPSNTLSLEHMHYQATGAMIVIREEDLEPRRIRRVARDLATQILREVAAKKRR